MNMQHIETVHTLKLCMLPWLQLAL